MTRSALTPALLAVAAAIGLGVAVASPAAASYDDQAVYAADYPVELFYDNDVTGQTQDYVAFVGFTAAEFCDYPDNTSPVVAMSVKPNGQESDRYRLTTRVRAEIYEYTGGGVFDFEADYCDAVLPEPYATGEGVLRIRGTSTYEPGFMPDPEDWFIDAFDPPPPGQLDRAERNWFRGSLRTADGDRVQVAAYASVPTFYGPPEAVSIDVRGGPR